MTLKSPEPKHYVTCRELSGSLEKNGKPVAHAKIIRTLKWNGNEEGIVDYFKTDDKGHFHIPKNDQILSISPFDQFVAKASIKIQHENETSDLWYEVLMNQMPHSLGDIMSLKCELSTESKRVFSESGLLGTICTWNNMPQEEDPYAL